MLSCAESLASASLIRVAAIIPANLPVDCNSTSSSERMHNYICAGCGTQFGETDRPPENCPICEDERQFINPKGQRWTTLDQLRAAHSNLVEAEGESLFGIGTEPSFAIGQRALLVQSPRRKSVVGLRVVARRSNGRPRQRAGWHSRHRHFASAFLFRDGRVESRL